MTERRWGAVVLGALVILLGLGFWHLKDQDPARAGGSKRGKVAVIDLYGPISFSDDGFGVSDTDRVVRRLRALRRRPEVKAVVLRINSPGGSVAAVQEVHQEVVALKQAGKIVVSSFGDVAASGGYYVAAPSHKIVANPGTLTGSIGVVFQLGNVQELMKKVGVRIETLKSGDMKDSGSPFRTLREAERRHFLALINEAYGQFFQAVADGRGLPARKLRPLADGRVFTGSQAKDFGLVDVLGNYETALDVARELAGIKTDEEPMVFAPSPFEKFMRLIGASFRSRLPVAWPAQGVRFEYTWE
jgi:protease IV